MPQKSLERSSRETRSDPKNQMKNPKQKLRTMTSNRKNYIESEDKSHVKSNGNSLRSKRKLSSNKPYRDPDIKEGKQMMEKRLGKQEADIIMAAAKKRGLNKILGHQELGKVRNNVEAFVTECMKLWYDDTLSHAYWQLGEDNAKAKEIIANVWQSFSVAVYRGEFQHKDESDTQWLIYKMARMEISEFKKKVQSTSEPSEEELGRGVDVSAERDQLATLRAHETLARTVKLLRAKEKDRIVSRLVHVRPRKGGCKNRSSIMSRKRRRRPQSSNSKPWTERKRVNEFVGNPGSFEEMLN